MDMSKLALLFQYALACAAQADDFRDRELGPIHLLKYAYLADLAYAEANEGRTFTGVPWRFHHFGPWATEAWEEIPNAMAAIDTEHRQFPSPYREDNHRWRMRTRSEPDTIVGSVPGPCARAIRRSVHEFGRDTYALLHHVYKTPPMLRAAPGQTLDFHPGSPKHPDSQQADSSSAADLAPLPALSKTKLKKLRAAVQAKLAEKKAAKKAEVTPAPRYDEVFYEGVAWLDSLAGEPVDEQEGVLRFEEAMWSSRARGEGELP